MCSLTAFKIAELNDRLRKASDNSLGQVMLTSGFTALPVDVQAAALLLIRTFDAFTEDNDPHSEHDFGSVTVGGSKVFWKISYYDRASFLKGQEYGSEHPESADETWRVLTVMLAEEY